MNIKTENEMQCEVCGIGTREQKEIRYTLLKDDELIVVEGVPATVCDHCGETSIAPDVVEKLQHTIWDQKPAKTIQATVYEFV